VKGRLTLMFKYTTFIGMDVHTKSISIAIANAKGVEFFGSINNNPAAIENFLQKLRVSFDQIYACYEAGPCGYDLYWYLNKRGIKCDVIAPSLIPTRSGDRVKTDRRDATRLAKLLQSDELTPCWVPNEEDEALRDLIRCREDAVEMLRIARQQISSFLRRHNKVPEAGIKNWGTKYMGWLRSLKFENEVQQYTFKSYLLTVDQVEENLKRLNLEVDARSREHSRWEVIRNLTALKGVDILTAATAVVEVGLFSRFENPRGLMSYTGLVPAEYSSGGKRQQGSITKAGNAHLRRVLGEAAQHAYGNLNLGVAIKR